MAPELSVRGLHVLIDPGRVPTSRLDGFLGDIAEAGARVVQVRVKGATDADGLAYTERAVARVRALGLVSIVNDRVDWALAAGADGVHLGQDDTPLAEARRGAPDFILGASAGTLQELEVAYQSGADYVGIGPVYATPSKPDAGSPLTPAGLRALVTWLENQPNPPSAVAIGGILPDNAATVWHTGVAGLAVIQAVCGAPDPKAAVRALLAARSAYPDVGAGSHGRY
ncbi:MAG: thiamine phosphate synthase [Thermaerobacter sp.]|nr:thiamine phosphate synthase [Thermaerobacter sp.]